jgi:Fe-S cluster assembly protein SufD
VQPDAQQTDAVQNNHNLLLSPDAEVDTMPQLEIYADDVKCAHGASVGQLDKDAIFYLRSRGVAEAEARHMLTRGFMADVLDELEPLPLRQYLQHRIDRLMSAAREAT